MACKINILEAIIHLRGTWPEEEGLVSLAKEKEKNSVQSGFVIFKMFRPFWINDRTDHSFYQERLVVNPTYLIHGPFAGLEILMFFE